MLTCNARQLTFRKAGEQFFCWSGLGWVLESFCLTHGSHCSFKLQVVLKHPCWCLLRIRRFSDRLSAQCRKPRGCLVSDARRLCLVFSCFNKIDCWVSLGIAGLVNIDIGWLGYIDHAWPILTCCRCASALLLVWKRSAAASTDVWCQVKFVQFGSAPKIGRNSKTWLLHVYKLYQMYQQIV